MDNERTKRASKFMSLVLRHQPEVADLTLDPQGWVEVESLLAALRERALLHSRAEIEAVVANNDKQRFVLSDDGLRIRANQGHSVEVDLGLEPRDPPELLYHGTVDRFIAAIREGGLKPQTRQYVHLSADVSAAHAVGGRRGKPVVLQIRAGELHRTGHVFFLSLNGVWLTETVPPGFIDFPRAETPGGDDSAVNPEARLILEICRQGFYEAAGRERVSIEEQQGAAEANSRLYLPSELSALRSKLETPGEGDLRRIISVRAATSQEAARDFSNSGDVVLLNYASARNPGGGFLGGAKAQEEELCRCSGLYRTLVRHTKYYQHNHAHRTLLYDDHLIYSPRVPFFRMTTGAGFLSAPFSASVITAPAPNAGAILQSQPEHEAAIRETFLRRWSNVFAVAADRGHRDVVVGAWGCGAFRNDPRLVAETAREVLLSRGMARYFDRVVFAIPDMDRVSVRNLDQFRAVFET